MSRRTAAALAATMLLSGCEPGDMMASLGALVIKATCSVLPERCEPSTTADAGGASDVAMGPPTPIEGDAAILVGAWTCDLSSPDMKARADIVYDEAGAFETTLVFRSEDESGMDARAEGAWRLDGRTLSVEFRKVEMTGMMIEGHPIPMTSAPPGMASRMVSKRSSQRIETLTETTLVARGGGSRTRCSRAS